MFNKVLSLALKLVAKKSTIKAISIVLFCGLFSNTAFATTIKGDVNGVYGSASSPHIWGWACQTGYNQSITVHLYVGGPAGSGTYVGSTSTNQSTESAVNSTCGTSSAKHRYRFYLSQSTLQAHQGKKIYVHGISVAGTPNLAVARSGSHSIPAPLPPAPTVSSSYSPSTVTSGQQTTYSWSATNATSCVNQAGVSRSTSGGSFAYTPTSTHTETLTCTGAGGSGSSTKTITVNPPPAPTVSSSYSPSTVTSGQQTTYSWSVSNATSCVNQAGVSRSVNGGSFSYVPTSTHTETLTCTGAGGSRSSTKTITVDIPPPPTVSSSWSPATAYTLGENQTYSWSVSGNVTSCQNQAGVSRSTSGGSFDVNASSTGTFTETITCTGLGGSNSSTKTRKVSVVKGYVDGVYDTETANPYIRGWACQAEEAATIGVHLYVNGSAGAGGGSFVKGANADQAPESAISQSCGTSGIGHRFKIYLTQSELESHQGKSIHVHGLSTTGVGSQNLVLTHSGNFSIPAPLPVPTITTFEWSPQEVELGTEQTLSWTATGVDSCELNQDGSSLAIDDSITATGTATGTYTDDIVCTASNGGGTASATASRTVTAPPSVVKGDINGIDGPVEAPYIKGWACQTGEAISIDVSLYVGGQAGSGGTPVKTVAASLSSEQAVSDACGTTSTNHRFEIPLTQAELESHEGKTIYVHGISTTGVGSANLAIARSGTHLIPAPIAVMSIPDLEVGLVQMVPIITGDITTFIPVNIPINPLDQVVTVDEGTFTINWDSASPAGTVYVLSINDNGVITELYSGSEMSFDDERVVGSYNYGIQACETAARTNCSDEVWVSVDVVLPGTTEPVTETVTYYHNNLLGSPVVTTDESGAVTWKAEYNPFGEKSLTTNISENRIGYTGHVDDASTGLTYMQARYYDPVIGRFMGIDPIGYAQAEPMSFNRYSYANNNPYIYTDPDGEWVNFVIGAGVGIIAEIAVQVVFEDRSFTSLDGGAILQSGVTGALSGGTGGAAAKLTSKLISGPASALAKGSSAVITEGASFSVGASKVVTGAISGIVGGATGGAVNNATNQFVDTGTIDPSGVIQTARFGALTGGLGGATVGAARANTAKQLLGDSRATTAFTSFQPGERSAAVAGAVSSTVSSTIAKATND